MKKIIFLFFLAGLVVPLYAQDNFDQDSVYYTPIPKPVPENKVNTGKLFGYFFTMSSGALVGCSDCSFRKEITFTTTVVNGVTMGKKLRLGVGVGYDAYYFWQSTPFSGMVSWDLIGNKDKNALFVQVAYGWAKVWSNGSDEYGLKNVEGGQTATTQIGYRIRYHDIKFALSIGTKFQQVTAYYEYPTYYYLYVGPMQGASSTKSIQQNLNRLQINLTIGLN
jgi:hypothetical protein